MPFSFQCSEIQPDIYEIHLNVWALGHNKADNATDKKYVFDIGPHDPVSSKVFISEGRYLFVHCEFDNYR